MEHTVQMKKKDIGRNRQKTKLFDYKDKKYNFIVDFSMNRKKYTKIYITQNDRKIHWQDGNTWQQMYA